MNRFLMNSPGAERAQIELVLDDNEKITLDRYTAGDVAYNCLLMEPIKEKLKILYLEQKVMPARPYDEKKEPVDRNKWLRIRLNELYITFGEK